MRALCRAVPSASAPGTAIWARIRCCPACAAARAAAARHRLVRRDALPHGRGLRGARALRDLRRDRHLGRGLSRRRLRRGRRAAGALRTIELNLEPVGGQLGLQRAAARAGARTSCRRWWRSCWHERRDEAVVLTRRLVRASNTVNPPGNEAAGDRDAGGHAGGCGVRGAAGRPGARPAQPVARHRRQRRRRACPGLHRASRRRAAGRGAVAASTRSPARATATGCSAAARPT